MNIVLITPTPPNIHAFGVRTISSVLKQAGFSPKTIFLPEGIEHLRFDASYIYQYPEKALDQISELCKDADLIGFSFMSQYFDRAAQITAYLKKRFAVPIIWGGAHPTCRPESCIDDCDAVCVGEGERAMVMMAEKISKGQPCHDIENCWFRNNGNITKNQTGFVTENLDELPFLDYDINDHYVYDWRSGDIIPIDQRIMKEQFLRMLYYNDKHLITYRTMTSRGCPHRCSYCASSAMMKLRRRTVDHVMRELQNILNTFDYIELISFFDDTFFAASIEYFEEFRDKYKKKIGLPFHAQCSPTTISERKLNVLVDAGLYFTEMGIQTGSEKIQAMYRRIVPNKKVIDAAALINKYRANLLIPDYHVILDNDWESANDVKDTLDLLLRLPGKFGLQISSLILFPGTELNEKARQEGLLKDELNEICRKPFTYPRGTYLNYLIYLSGFPVVPRRLLKFLARDIFVKCFHSQKPSRFFALLYVLTEKLRLAGKGVVSLLKGDVKRIANYFRLAR